MLDTLDFTKTTAKTLTTRFNDVEIQKIIQTAMNYPMEKVLARYGKEQNLDAETVRLHERELKRFLCICAVYENRIGMRGPVDELWHTFVIYTRIYADFCQKVAGRFIHHTPNDDTKPSKKKDALPRTFDLGYEALFGTTPPAQVWPATMVPCGDDACTDCVDDCC